MTNMTQLINELIQLMDTICDSNLSRGEVVILRSLLDDHIQFLNKKISEEL